MREFPDVFQDYFPWIPLKREIDFCIDLLPDTNPILIPLYRMALAELKKFKAQLDECFIQTSVSPWGEPVLFVQKKDGSLSICIDYN